MADLAHPPMSLLCKLASIAVHAEEYHSPHGHPLDLDALKSNLADPEVQEWVAAMGAASLIPLKRNP